MAQSFSRLKDRLGNFLLPQTDSSIVAHGDSTVAAVLESLQRPGWNLLKDGNFSRLYAGEFCWVNDLEAPQAFMDERFGWSAKLGQGTTMANDAATLMSASKTYTLSFWAWGNTSEMQFRCGGTTLYQPAADNGWLASDGADFHSVTFEAPASGYLGIYKGTAMTSGAWLAMMKLEEGSAATLWLPHPSELDLSKMQ